MNLKIVPTKTYFLHNTIQLINSRITYGKTLISHKKIFQKKRIIRVFFIDYRSSIDQLFSHVDVSET